jgi:hypothetical protein
LRIVGRVNGSVTQIAEPVSTPLTAEVGAALDVEASLAPWLRLVARSLFRTPIVLEGLVPPSTLYGIVSRLDLMATY